jgi:predicted nucleotidyltransferase
MGKTADKLTAAEREQYHLYAKMRQAQAEQELAARRQRAWELAREAARLLREHHDVIRVAVFGSLLDESRFTMASDVDIAAWGIPAEKTFRAMSDVWDLGIVEGIPINLVDINACRQSLREAIYREGVDI